MGIFKKCKFVIMNKSSSSITGGEAIDEIGYTTILEGYIGIPLWNGTVKNSSRYPDSAFFTETLDSQNENKYLGFTLGYKSPQYPESRFPSYFPGMKFELSNAVSGPEKAQSNFDAIILDSGWGFYNGTSGSYYITFEPDGLGVIRTNRIKGTSASDLMVDTMFYARTWDYQFIYYSTLGVTAINSDGTIPTDATFGKFVNENVGYCKINAYKNSATNRFVNILNSTKSYNPDNPTDDPYQDNPDDGEEDGPTGGQGNFDNTSDPVVDPLIPEELEANSALNSGFLNLYNPTASQLSSLASFMWSGFDVNSLKKIFSEPMETIIGLWTVPVQPTVTSEASTIYLGDVASNASAKRITQQYLVKDMGTLSILEYWGAYLDYNPYTTIDLYLPYVGSIPIDPDDFMGATMGIKYHIDVLSGEALVTVTAANLVMLQVQASVIQQIPITANDHTQQITSVISAVLSGVAAFAAIKGNNAQLESGNAKPITTANSNRSAMISGASSSAKSIMSAKERYTKSGGLSGGSAHLGVRYPYIIYRRARQSLPAGQNAFTGYPSNMTKMISNMSGFTKIDAVNLIAPSATEPEVNEILDLLQTGVII